MTAEQIEQAAQYLDAYAESSGCNGCDENERGAKECARMLRQIAATHSLPATEKREPLTLAARIDELAGRHGSLRAAARVLEVDPGYLTRLRSGEKDDPGETLLRRMGLKRFVVYADASKQIPDDVAIFNYYGRVVGVMTGIGTHNATGGGA